MNETAADQSSTSFDSLNPKECLRKQRELVEQYNQTLIDFRKFEDEKTARVNRERDEISKATSEFENIIQSASGYDTDGILNRGGTSYFTDSTYTTHLSPAQDYRQLVNDARGLLQNISSAKSKSDPRRKWAIAAIVGAIPLYCILSLILSTSGASNRSAGNLLCLPYLLFIGGVIAFFILRSRPNSERLQSLTRLANLKNKAEYLETKWRDQADSDADHAIERKTEELARSSENFRKPLVELNQKLEPYMKDTLDIPAWSDWQPSTDFPPVIRLGNTYLRGPLGEKELFGVSALLPFPESLNLLFLATDFGKRMAVTAIQNIALRILAYVPPGKAKFTFIDPIGLGQNAAEFMLLSDYDDSLVSGKVWTAPDQIRQRLVDLSEHIENVIQKYLRNQYATIEDYNAQAGEIAEPYRFLVVFDFPANFDDDSARLLNAIAQNGPRCGVHTLVMVDTEKELPRSFNPQELERVSIALAYEDEHTDFRWNDSEFFYHSFSVDFGKIEPELFNLILTKVGEATKGKNKIEVPMEKLFEIFNKQVSKFSADFPGIKTAIHISKPSTWWHGSTGDNLVVPLGRLGAEKVQSMVLGHGTSQHVLIAGKTGSGKSSLLHVLITSTALIYSPDEVELYLIDFKKGVEFKSYVSHRLPHARVIAVESEREFGLSVLQGLNDQLSARGDLFRSEEVQNLSDYRAKTKAKLPRILLLVDEFQEFFTDDDAIASQASQILDRLVRQGRAFGIHVILGSQTLSGAYSLARSTIDQMAVRIALQCSETDSRLILADENPAARLLAHPGEAIYNAENGKIEGNNRFQTAWLPDEERDTLLEECQAYANEVHYAPIQAPIYFEGNTPASIESNKMLEHQLQAYPPGEDNLAIQTWVGDPVAIRDPLAITFHRQSGSNLLIVGQKEHTIYGILGAQVLSIASQMKRNSGKNINIIDFSAGDSPYVNYFCALQEQIHYPMEVCRKRQMPEVLSELAAETKSRLDEDKVNLPARFLFLVGIQRARDLRPSDPYSSTLPDSTNGEVPQVDLSQLLVSILRDGPEVGIHTVIWCDSYYQLVPQPRAANSARIRHALGAANGCRGFVKPDRFDTRQQIGCI